MRSLLKKELDAGYDPTLRLTDCSIIEMACQSDDVFTIKAILDAGYKVNAPLFNTPILHIALQHEAKDVVPYLLANGANPNQKDSQGRLPLWVCLEVNNFESLLLKAGAKADLENSCLIQYLTTKERTDLIPHAIELGANINCQSDRN